MTLVLCGLNLMFIFIIGCLHFHNWVFCKETVPTTKFGIQCVLTASSLVATELSHSMGIAAVEFGIIVGHTVLKPSLGTIPLHFQVYHCNTLLMQLYVSRVQGYAPLTFKRDSNACFLELVDIVLISDTCGSLDGKIMTHVLDMVHHCIVVHTNLLCNSSSDPHFSLNFCRIMHSLMQWSLQIVVQSGTLLTKVLHSSRLVTPQNFIYQLQSNIQRS